MKHLTLLPLFSIIIATGCSTSTNSHRIEQLYGGWHCNLTIVEEGIEVTSDYEVNYVRNGKTNAYGIVAFEMPPLGNVEYSLTTSGDWQYEDGYLIETINDFKFISISHPELDDMLNMDDVLPKSITESSEILTLNDSELIVKMEMDGSIVNCDRIDQQS